jgi:cytochrome c oxidase subunit 3
MGTTTLTKPERIAQPGHTGRGGGFQGDDGSGGGDPGESRRWRVPMRTYRTGMWLGLAGIVMLFAAFTSALVVRKGLGEGWGSTPIPRILWMNTLILILSSATLELSRRALTRRDSIRFAGWLYAATALGLVFLAGQVAAWRELAAGGFYLATNTSASFLYLLTAAHGVHLLGGIMALAYLMIRAQAIALGRQRRTAVDATAIYWHFMDGLWIYILFLLLTRL